jgi:hypothetical protein
MIKYIGDLKRRYDHIKVIGNDEAEEYKGAMVIYKEGLPGVSFCITEEAIWKYIDPCDNMERKTIESDVREFNQILMRNQAAQKLSKTVRLSEIVKARIVEDALCISFSIALNKTLRIMFCTGYNLGKCLHIFGIDPQPQAAIQLLLWIQDGLNDLKDLPVEIPESTVSCGEVTMIIDGTKITKELTLNETDLITGE